MSQPVAVVIGIGPGNGEAISRALSVAGYRVALLTRSREKLDQLAAELEGASGFVADVTDEASLVSAFDQVRSQMGEPAVLVYNAGGGFWGTVEEMTVGDMERGWRTNVAGLLVAAQQVIAPMRQTGSGNIVVIGATAALRGKQKTSGFASAKAGQRSLAQSMARHLGPDGIHVSYIVIDGMILQTGSRAFAPDADDEFFLDANDIAKTVLHLIDQPRSAWSFEVDLRPFGEVW